VKKVYEVTVRGRYSPKLAEKMSKGVRIDTGVTAPCEIEVIGYENAEPAIALTKLPDSTL
jgi:23S rRNA pseudouridine2605 synthase